jgi:hypothetical protein
MSRAGYSEDLDPLDLGRWRGRVASAIRGRRGQQLLRDTLTALDAMPEKRLIAHELRQEGEVCTLGSVLVARGFIEPEKFDPEDHDGLGNSLNVSPCLIREIEYLNDECAPGEPEKRWAYMRRKIESLIKVQA